MKVIEDLENMDYEERLNGHMRLFEAPSKEEWQGERDMPAFGCHKAGVKQSSPCLSWTSWYVSGLALVKLKQRNRSLNWDFECFRNIKVVLMLVKNNINVLVLSGVAL